MNIWLTTDTHYDHEALTAIGRPPKAGDLIYANLQRVVKPNDLLIHLGDVGVGHDLSFHRKYIEGADYRQVLTAGNHDKKSFTWYMEHGWTFVCEEFRWTMYGLRLVFSHQPVPYDGSFEVNIHGHFHNDTRRSADPGVEHYSTDYHRLLALELTNYQPVLLRTFLESDMVRRAQRMQSLHAAAQEIE